MRYKLEKIDPNPDNPRVIKDERYAKALRSVAQFPQMLQIRGLALDIQPDGRAVSLGGNQRLKCLKDLKAKHKNKEAFLAEYETTGEAWEVLADYYKNGVPCHDCTGMTEAQKKRFVIADNVDFGDWDAGVLGANWGNEDLGAWGVDVGGFKVEQKPVEDDYEAPDVDEVQTDIVAGDLFEIGPHRLLCGDSTDSEQVGMLMNGEKIQSVVTDPPYGINWDGDYTRFQKNGIAESSTNYEDIKNDDAPFDPSKWTGFNEVIMWGGNIFSNKLNTGTWLVWDKRSEDGTSFLADAEVAWQKGGYGVYIKSINQQSEKSKLKDIRHPTKKPVELMRWCIERLKDNRLIVDPYLGSGTTMVAAHQFGCNCYGMEIEPKYCQIIVNRMLKLDPDLVVLKNGQPYQPK